LFGSSMYSDCYNVSALPKKGVRWECLEVVRNIYIVVAQHPTLN
jgi:hypothetical protein